MSKKSIVTQSKQAERHVADLLNGRRLHAGEWGGKGDIDVIGPHIIAQVKQRSNVPGYVTEGMQQLREAAESQEELRRLDPEITGYPLPVLAITTKPGRGKRAETFFILDAYTFGRLQFLFEARAKMARIETTADGNHAVIGEERNDA